jgi:hypothetical protein
MGAATGEPRLLIDLPIESLGGAYNLIARRLAFNENIVWLL